MSIVSLPSLHETIAAAESAFVDHFNAPAEYLVASPGRVNLIGEHIDYCDGYVMPFALPVYAVFAATVVPGRRTIVLSAGGEFTDVEVSLDEPITAAKNCWGNYAKGVLAGFLARGHEVPHGFDVCLVSDVPLGAGLSSSAAIEVSFATLLEAITGITLGKKEKALLCQKAEHDYANVPCGIMDQFASAFGEEGKLVLIDCMKEEAELVPFERDDLTVLIANTRVSHQLNDGGYAKRRAQTEEALRAIGKPSWRGVTMADVDAVQAELGDEVYRRARHVVTETERTLAAADALENGEMETLGKLMYASHDSLRDDFEVSCKELDVLVNAARKLGSENGVIGARMTGGGFGGSTVTLCQSELAVQVADFLAKSYKAETGIDAQIIAARPSQGALVFKGK